MQTTPPIDVSPLEQPVSLIMTTGELITADAEDDLAVALEVFRQGRISHIPVLSEGSKLVGVVSIGDVVRAIIAQQADTIDTLHTMITDPYPG